MTEVEVLAKTMWGEARGEGVLGMYAVGNVIANRVARPSWWGHSFETVCLKPYQFSCWNSNDPNREKMLAVTISDKDYALAEHIAARVIAGVPDITNGADSYCTKDVWPTTDWAKELSPTAEIGHHVFFRVQ